MEAREYQQQAMRTASTDMDERDALTVSALGLCGEAGEFADTIKKWRYHDHPLDREELVKELGDVLWYVARACEALDVGMDVVMQANIDKLRQRYPDGFSAERSRNRVER